MSGVKGLVGENWPPTTGLVSSLHLLGRPCPDSSTYTWKLFLLPVKAMPTGKFRPLAKTETLKPGGTTMSSPVTWAVVRGVVWADRVGKDHGKRRR